MSSSPLLSDEVADEGQGYADGGKEPTASVGSSILDSTGSGDREVEEANIVLEIDVAREWTDSAPPPPVNGYGWAPYEVGLYAPYYVTSTSLEYLASRLSIVSTAKDADNILLTVCRSNERACHGREGHNTDFFYVYSTLFRDLGVRLPFTDFQSNVLRDLNVAPTQLHPNGSGYMRAIVVVCTTLALTPRSTAFLHFFRAIPFFKVSIKEEGRFSFYLDEGQPKFPFYWTEHPKKVVSRAKSSMTPEEFEIVGLIDQLPRKTSSRALIGLLDSHSLYIFKEMEKNKAFLLMMSRREAELKKSGAGTSSRPARSLTIPNRPDPAKAPRTVNPAFKIAPYSSPSTTPSAVQVEDEVSLQGREKRKAIKDKSISSSKKIKRKVSAGPLPAGPFDSTVHLVDRLEYRLDPEEKKLFHGMTTGEAVDLAYELNVRANLCLAYAADSAKSIIGDAPFFLCSPRAPRWVPNVYV
ncbi:hypothetical protein LR48_Vigan11g091800 [Vigna angularis]|uniref:Transposase (putative) gypsy type domain-containing protein n=1 Tax=Phaseolus angularis TaxID=3914 RepID=A0A0L9VS43_PHAAN|nr:hypothetical protein LR48_Vigan11g091800 [Vigna angularis]